MKRILVNLTCMRWFFKQLWLLSARNDISVFCYLPDTILFLNGKPMLWISTDNDSKLKRELFRNPLNHLVHLNSIDYMFEILINKKYNLNRGSLRDDNVNFILNIQSNDKRYDENDDFVIIWYIDGSHEILNIMTYKKLIKLYQWRIQVSILQLYIMPNNICHGTFDSNLPPIKNPLCKINIYNTITNDLCHLFSDYCDYFYLPESVNNIIYNDLLIEKPVFTVEYLDVMFTEDKYGVIWIHYPCEIHVKLSKDITDCSNVGQLSHSITCLLRNYQQMEDDWKRFFLDSGYTKNIQSLTLAEFKSAIKKHDINFNDNVYNSFISQFPKSIYKLIEKEHLNIYLFQKNKVLPFSFSSSIVQSGEMDKSLCQTNTIRSFSSNASNISNIFEKYSSNRDQQVNSTKYDTKMSIFRNSNSIGPYNYDSDMNISNNSNDNKIIQRKLSIIPTKKLSLNDILKMSNQNSRVVTPNIATNHHKSKITILPGPTPAVLNNNITSTSNNNSDTHLNSHTKITYKVSINNEMNYRPYNSKNSLDNNVNTYNKNSNNSVICHSSSVNNIVNTKSSLNNSLENENNLNRNEIFKSGVIRSSKSSLDISHKSSTNEKYIPINNNNNEKRRGITSHKSSLNCFPSNTNFPSKNTYQSSSQTKHNSRSSMNTNKLSKNDFNYVGLFPSIDYIPPSFACSNGTRKLSLYSTWETNLRGENSSSISPPRKFV